MELVLQKFKKQIILFVTDTFLFFFLLFIVLSFRHFDVINFDYFFGHVKSFLLIYIFFIVSLYIADLYNVFDIIRKITKVKRVFYSILGSFFFGITYFYLFASDFTPKTILLFHSFLLFIFISFVRISFSRLQFTKNKIKSILISDKVEGLEILQEFAKGHYSIDFCLHISPIYLENKSKEEIKTLLLNYIKLHNISMIVLDVRDQCLEKLMEAVLLDKDFKNKTVLDMLDLYEYVFRKAPLASINYKWLLYSTNYNGQNRIYNIAKRCIEIIVSIPILIIWGFLHPFVYFNLKREIKSGEGEDIILMKRERVGLNGKKIRVLKYRTMLYSDPGKKWIGEDRSNRVTKFGNFLRKTRIDELPQILSVIKGDISLVGPRQDEVGLYEKLKDEIDNYDFRYIVKPGLSGWAQTMMQTPPQSVEESRLRFSYDMYYVKNQSLFLDIVIILRTIKTVLNREG